MCALYFAGLIGYIPVGPVLFIQAIKALGLPDDIQGYDYIIHRPNYRAESRVSLCHLKYPAPDKTPDIGNQKTYSNTHVSHAEIQLNSSKMTYADSVQCAANTQSIPVTTSHVPNGANMPKNAWTKTASHWNQMNKLTRFIH